MPKICTCDGAGRGPGRACVVKAGGKLGELWQCAEEAAAAAAPQAQGGAVAPSIEELQQFAADLVREERLIWLGFNQDSGGEWTIPSISSSVHTLVVESLRRFATTPPAQRVEQAAEAPDGWVLQGQLAAAYSAGANPPSGWKGLPGLFPVRKLATISASPAAGAQEKMP